MWEISVNVEQHSYWQPETRSASECLHIVFVHSSDKLRAHFELFLHQSTRENGLKVRQRLWSCLIVCSFCLFSGKLAQWLTFFALKDGILYRRVGINEEDAWETASGAATSETFLGIPGTLDASKKDLKVRTVLPGGACVQIFTGKFAGSGKTFEHSAPNLRRRTSTECTKTAGGDSLLERFFQTAKCPIPSFSENFHP